MSKIGPMDDGGAAMRQERINQAAAARRLVKEASKDDHNTNTAKGKADSDTRGCDYAIAASR